jgi:alkanesulfonate monooxygenase SsuD/methylene tetrahydromethanopterin reductase-like flavin-dependent oxidoreductase (luciferase family)
VDKELAAYRVQYRELNGAEAPAPIVAGWTFVDPDAGRALDMAKQYIGGYFHSVVSHYQFAERHLASTKGYEYYGKIADKIAEIGEDRFVEFFMGLQVYGTPEECIERIAGVRQRIGSDAYVGVFSYAGLPPEEAERNMRLFAAEVMPALKAMPELAGAEADADAAQDVA